MNMEKSLLMMDEWGSNHGYEAMLDFQMQWLLKLSAEKDVDDNHKRLHEISKGITRTLIGYKQNESNVNIEEVKVWRQWERTDLKAEIEVMAKGRKERHVVVIEDKAYTFLHNDQLERYADSVDKYYPDMDDSNKHFWVITIREFDDKYLEAMKAQCKNTKWKVLSFYEVIGWEKSNFEDTGIDLFDQFWLRKWY